MEEKRRNKMTDRIPKGHGAIEYGTPYHWNVSGVSASIQEMVAIIAKEYLRVKEHIKLLDIGCGDGYMTNRLWASGRDIIGIDVSQSGLNFARLLSNTRINYIRADVCSLPFPDSRFDFITIFDTIEHIKDDNLAVKEISRVLKPNGKVILTTANRLRLFEYLNIKHWREYSPRELKRLMSRCFRCLELRGIFFYLPLLGLWGPTRTLLMFLGLVMPLMSRRLLYVGEKL